MRAAFDVGKIAIRPSNSGTFLLSIPIIQKRGVSLDIVTVGLDASMVAEPPQLDPTYTQTLGITGPSMNRQARAYAVSPNRREVTWTLPHVGLRASLSVIEASFSWRLPSITPDRVSINISSSVAGLLTSRFSVSGLNVSPTKVIRSQLSSFLAATNSSHFLFSNEASITDGILIAYGQFSDIVATAQRFPKTAVSGTTWPAEMEFWASKSGSLFLAYQHANLHYRDGTPSQRLALCPFSLGTSESNLRGFLVELELQSRLGVEVRMVSAEQYVLLLSSTDALMSLGTQIGVQYGAAAELSVGSPSETRLFLANESTDYSKEIYNRAFSAATRWEEYKTQRGVIFSTLEEEAIRGKQLYVQLISRREKNKLVMEG